jgi:hypothetical protein
MMILLIKSPVAYM